MEVTNKKMAFEIPSPMFGKSQNFFGIFVGTLPTFGENTSVTVHKLGIWLHSSIYFWPKIRIIFYTTYNIVIKFKAESLSLRVSQSSLSESCSSQFFTLLPFCLTLSADSESWAFIFLLLQTDPKDAFLLNTHYLCKIILSPCLSFEK